MLDARNRGCTLPDYRFRTHRIMGQVINPPRPVVGHGKWFEGDRQVAPHVKQRLHFSGNAYMFFYI
jgi:hypothetical protein